MTSNIELGFVQEAPDWKLQSRFFPSKVGGKPAWLDLLNIPDIKHLICNKCKQPYIFLCQIYAPIDKFEACYHRTIYIFMCKNDVCCNINSASNFKVLRNQLPRKNDFYPMDPPVECESWRTDLCSEKFGVHLCVICGIKSTSLCAKCKKVYYCSKEHQKADWKRHKETCNDNAMQTEKKCYKSCLLLPEYELITDTEEYNLKNVNEETEKGQLEQLEHYKKLVLEGKAGTLHDISSVEDDLSKMAFSEEDKTFCKFKSRISMDADQVLRYEKDGVPLWISKHGVPNEEDILPCEHCGGQRTFEFQVLPQLLNYLGLDKTSTSIDWGVLAIYTCKQSCSSGSHYREEYIWKQDIIATEN